MKRAFSQVIILLIMSACTKFDYNNPVDPDVKKDPPVLISPADSSISNNNTPTFAWTADGEATAYTLQVDDSSNFLSPEIDQTNIATNSYTSTDTLPDGQYCWRVRTNYGQDAWKDWSTSKQIIIDTQGPTASLLSAPANNDSIIDNTPAFDWSDVSGAVCYELIVDNVPDFSGPEIDETTLTTSGYTASGSLPDGTYYWKVKAKNSLGNWSEWSGSWRFTIDTRGLDAPILILPDDNDIFNNPTPFYDWSDVSGSKAYELQVDNNSSFGSPEFSDTSLTGSSYTATRALDDDAYYWRVRSKGNLEYWGNWSSARRFTVDTEAPGVPTLSNPINRAFIYDITPLFEWSYASGSKTYELQVDDDNSFGSPEIDINSLTSPHYTSTDPFSNDTYYWRVRAKDLAGNWGDWSDVLSFNLEAVTDIDGNIYQIVRIGNQIWMAENLKVTHYRNGDPIPNVTDKTKWEGLSTGAYCVYDNNESNADIYGYLYNWYAVDDSRNLAPEGWHVPTDEEWKQLEKYLGMSQQEADDLYGRGTYEGEKLKAYSGWDWGNGTNSSGFSALPGGERGANGDYSSMGRSASFWSSTALDYGDYAWYRALDSYNSVIMRYYPPMREGLSVRCVRDKK